MRADFNVRGRTVVGIAAGGFISMSASAAIAQSIQGTATYRERIALQSAAVFEAALEDVTRADAPAETIGRTRMASPGNPPIAFTIAYDPSKIAPDHRYVIRARILVDDKSLFATDTAAPVITRGSPLNVSLTMRRVGGGQTAPGSGGSKPLEGTYWKAIELGGKPTPTQDPKREAYLQFQGGRVAGWLGSTRLCTGPLWERSRTRRRCSCW